jgi:hypothetical protein
MSFGGKTFVWAPYGESICVSAQLYMRQSFSTPNSDPPAIRRRPGSASDLRTRKQKPRRQRCNNARVDGGSDQTRAPRGHRDCCHSAAMWTQDRLRLIQRQHRRDAAIFTGLLSRCNAHYAHIVLYRQNKVIKLFGLIVKVPVYFPDKKMQAFLQRKLRTQTSARSFTALCGI